MEINSEVKNLLNGKDKKLVSENLLNQKEELEKNIYLVDAINLAFTIEDAVKSGLFKKYHISSLVMNLCYDRDIGKHLDFILIDKAGKPVSKYNSDHNHADVIEVFNKLDSVFNQTFGLNGEFISDTLKSKQGKNFILEENVKDQILDAILSKEIKTAFDYMVLEHSLEDNGNHTPKKMKL